MTIGFRSSKAKAEPEVDDHDHTGWPAGYADENSIDWIPEELRELARDGLPFYRVDPDEDRKAMIEAAASKHGAHVVNYGTPNPRNPELRRARVLEPTKSEADMQVWQHLARLRRARMFFNAEQSTREQEARDRVMWTCPSCNDFVPPTSLGNASIMGRTLPDGRSTKVCAKCHALARRLVEAELEAEAGRLERVRAYLGKLAS